MNPSLLSSRILPVLLTGTKRSDLPLAEVFGDTIETSDPAANLKALSLTGQYLRFSRPVQPSALKLAAPIPSDRPLLNEALRKTFCKLLHEVKNENAGLLSEAIAQALARKKIAPHPFDFETVEAFIINYAEDLGSQAFAFAQGQKPETEHTDYFDWSNLDASCWTKAPIRHRERFLSQQRQADPEMARTLLKADWLNCNAEIRYRLLNCLRAGLSEGDQEFLETLAKDRAPRVRDTASTMLALILQGEKSNSLKMLLERLKEGQAGLLRKKRSFSLEYPVNIKENKRLDWIVESFGQLTLRMLIRALNCSLDELLEGAKKDEGLLFFLVLAATNDKDFEHLTAIVSNFPGAWEGLAESNFTNLPNYSDAERKRWIEIVVRPMDWPAQTASSIWPRKLYELNEKASLSPDQFNALLHSTWAKSVLNSSDHFAYRAVELLALLCPASLRTELLEILRTDDTETQPARWFLEFMNSLEAFQYG